MDSQQTTYLLLFGVLFGLALLFVPNHSATIPRSFVAWRRASGFWLASFCIGALTLAMTGPPAPALPRDDLAWWLATSAYLSLVVVGYGIVWPIGTVCHGRPLRPFTAIVFGLFWGLGQSCIFLSIWLWLGRLCLGPWLTALLAYLAIAAYQAVWHGLFWDIKVSPPHNLKSWNAKKVALVHTPNLLFTLVYLVVFGDGYLWVVVVMQTVALVLSAWFMHYPRPLGAWAPRPEPDD